MSTRQKRLSLVGFFGLFVLLLMFSCQKEKTATVETIEGVEVIHNSKEPTPRSGTSSKITFEEELSIGEVTGREEYMFSMIRGVAITAENQLAVDDMGNKTIKFFTLEGNYVKSFSTAKIRMYFRTLFSKQGYILGMAANIDPQNLVYEIRKYDADFQFQKIIRTCPTPSPGKFNPFHPVFYYHIDKDDNIVYGFPETYEIQILNPEGDIIRRILKDYDPLEITEEEKEEQRKEVPEGINIVFLKYHPPFGTFSVDDEGRVIVRARERHEQKLRYVYDVFDPEGYYVAKFYLEARPLLWKKGKMYALAEDEEGYQSLKRFRVIWE